MADSRMTVRSNSGGVSVSTLWKTIITIALTLGVPGIGWIIVSQFGTQSRVGVLEMQNDAFVKREELSPLQQSVVGLEKDVGHIKEEQSKMYAVQQQMLTLQTDSMREQAKTQTLLQDVLDKERGGVKAAGHN